MTDMMIDLPQAESADPDGVQVALRAAQALWSRGDTSESLRWLRRAAESASDEGADLRSLQLAKAAAELRAMLFAAGDSVSPSIPAPEPPASAVAEGAPASVRPARIEDAHPPSRPPGSGPQYVVHRPREAPRQLMGLSSTTLETAAVPRDGSGHASVPSWSADGDRRLSSSPPPLPRAAVEDYEELDAEPEEEAEDPPIWSASAAHTASSNPPPLPTAHAFGEDDDMRSEQPTVVIPPPEEARSESRRNSSPPRDGATAEGRRELSAGWDRDAKAPSWDGASWEENGRARGFAGTTADASLSESAAPKLTARVHHQAVQVSFAPDPRVPGQFIVRALREGERPVAGERVALLVALEPGMPLV